MRTRLIVSLVLAMASIPILTLGLIDPLEGGLALLAGFLIGFAVRLLSGIPVPRFAWIALAVTASIGVVALAVAIPQFSAGMPDAAVEAQAAFRPLALLRWAWRLGVLAVMAGAVWYAARIVQAMRIAEQDPAAGSPGTRSAPGEPAARPPGAPETDPGRGRGV